MTFVVEEVPDVTRNYVVGDHVAATKWAISCFESKGIIFTALAPNHFPDSSCRLLLLSFPEHLAQVRAQINSLQPEVIYVLTDNATLGARILESGAARKTTIKVCVIDRTAAPRDMDIAIDFSSDGSKNLIRIGQSKEAHNQPSTPGDPSKKHFRKKPLLLVCAGFIMTLFIFLAPFGIGVLYLYKSSEAIRAKDMHAAQSDLQSARPFVEMSQSLYTASRPILSFFFVAFVFDPILDVQNNAYGLLNTSIAVWEDAQKLTMGAEQGLSGPQLDTIARTMADRSENISEYSQRLSDTIPTSLPPLKRLQAQLQEVATLSEKMQPFIAQLPTLLGGDQPHTYLVYFYNNMELRPGGGFIGSFAFVTFQRYRLVSFTVHDVYDADGQLKAHIDPPESIRSYLQQPHWFLRDSNVTPDFEENIHHGLFFLEKEFATLPQIDGVVGITTSGVGSLLSSFKSIYLPDYDETITSSNFYIKTQLESEKDFFPGSIRKKSFLSSLTHAILEKLPEASPTLLAANLKTVLDQRHLVLFFPDPATQKAVSDAGWHGKIVDTPCLSRTNNCINDYLMTTDMNVGLNKANYYVSRFVSIEPTIQSNHSAKTRIALSYRNDSPTELYPAGTYKTFTQVYIPLGASNIHLTDQSGKELLYETSNTLGRRVLGTYFEVPPLGQYTLIITYTLQAPAPGDISYQLVVQKQIGSINNDLSLNIRYPETLSLVSKNFQTLAKAQSVNYNTNLLADRVFVTEFHQRN